MTINAANWVGEYTVTTGTGPVTLAGAVRGFARFNVMGDGEVYYVIQDGIVKETGLGTLTGDVLERTTIHATIDINGVYSKTPVPIDLSGNAQVYGIVNAEFMQTLYNSSQTVFDAVTEVTDAAADAEAAKVAAEAAAQNASTDATNAASSAANAASSEQVAVSSAADAITAAQDADAALQVVLSAAGAVAGAAAYPYPYTAVSDNQLTIVLPSTMDVSAVNGMYLEGLYQTLGRNFEFDKESKTITLCKAANAGDEFTIMITGTASGAGDAYQQLIRSQAGASQVGTVGGKTVQQQLDNINSIITYLTPEAFGAKGDGIADDSVALQSAVDAAVSKSISAGGINLPVFVTLNAVYKITKTINVNGSKVRFMSVRGGGFYVDPTGAYTNNKVFIVSGSSPNSSYTGQAGSLFDGVTFVSSGKTLDLFHAVRNSTNSGDNGACLHNLSNISVRGFNRVFTHDSGGWGWTWIGCQFSGNTTLLNIIQAADTYERHSFFGCTWQNGGYAFVMNNPDGRIYWHGGSIDYCDGLATITAGYLEANGHNEWTARTLPLVSIKGSNAFVKMSGTLFVRNNTTTTYYIFDQNKDRQVLLDDIVFVTDGTNTARGLISNREVLKGNISLPNDAAKSIAYNSSDENIIHDTFVNGDYSLSVTTNHTVTVAGDKLTVTASASGTTSHLLIDIPVTGKTKLAFKMIASNTSPGVVFLNKFLLTPGKTSIADLSSQGTASWAGNAASVAGGSITVFDIPKQTGFLRLDFNVANLNASTSFTIESLKLFSC